MKNLKEHRKSFKHNDHDAGKIIRTIRVQKQVPGFVVSVVPVVFKSFFVVRTSRFKAGSAYP